MLNIVTSTVILDILYIFTWYVRTVIFAPTNYPKCIKIRNDTIIQNQFDDVYRSWK